MDRRKISYTKSRLMSQAVAVTMQVSRFFRQVRIGDEISMGPIYDIAHRIDEVGKALEAVAHDVSSEGMADHVFISISKQVYRLQIFAIELKNVSEKYFGFPVKALPVFTPTIRPEVSMGKTKQGLKELIDTLEEEE